MKKGTFLLLCMQLFALQAHASNSGVITLSVGPVWYQAGKTQTLTLYDDFLNTYVAGNTNKPLTSGELFIGLQHTLTPTIFGQLGLAYSMATSALPNGDIWETADPEFNNLTYQYKIEHKQLSLKGLLFSAPIHKVYQPYMGASLGVGFNESTHFSQTPKLVEIVSSPNFQSHQQTVFSYTLSAGVRRFIAKHWQIGAGYEFGDWGRSALSETADQTQSGALTVSHVYTHQLQLSVTYLFSEASV